MNERVSEHFTVAEMMKSHTAIRNGIDNTPNAEEIARGRELAIHILEPARDEFGSFSPNSWFRGEALEKRLCYSSFLKWCRRKSMPSNDEGWLVYFKRKSHPKGEAADIEIPGVTNLALYNWINENLEFDQLILEFYKADVPNSGWVHVSFRKGNNRNQAFTING